MLRTNLTALFLVALSMATTAHASADDVKCDNAASMLIAHFDKDFRKVFNSDYKDKLKDYDLNAYFYQMCEKGKATANTHFRSGKYDISSTAMSIKLQLSRSEIDENYMPMFTQYSAVAFMYGYVNWFVN